MTDTTPQPTQQLQQLIVEPAQGLRGQLKVTDPNGNYLQFPSQLRQVERSFSRNKDPLPAYVRNQAKTELCQLTIEEAAKIFLIAKKPVPGIGTPTYSFDAPIGSIPNLCPKDEGVAR